MSTTLAPEILLPTLDVQPYSYRDYRWDGDGFTHFLRNDDDRPETTEYMAGIALSIWNEAHNEEAHRERIKTSLSSVIVPLEPEEEEELQALIEGAGPVSDDKLAKLRALIKSKRELQISNDVQRACIEQLLTEQIKPDDSRLNELWERTSDEADRQGYCNVYDQIVDTIGGQTRAQVLDRVGRMATITVTTTRTIEMRGITSDEYNYDTINVEHYGEFEDLLSEAEHSDRSIEIQWL